MEVGKFGIKADERTSKEINMSLGQPLDARSLLTLFGPYKSDVTLIV